MSPPVLINVTSGNKTRTDKGKYDTERKSDFEDADDAEYECTSEDSMSQGEVSSNFVCDFCSMSFKTNNNLQKHLMRHSQIKTVRIGIGLQKTNDKKRLIYETDGCKSASITCGKCGVKFENESLLKQHSIEEHEEDTFKTNVPELLKCDICERTFKTKRGRQRHRCSDLVKPSFACDHCGQLFRSKSILSEHVNIHTRKKAFVCDVCNRIFAHRSTLRQHRHYVHLSEKQHKCEVCGKYLAHSAALKQHARLHTGELPYECDRCPRKFNTVANLRTHYYVHTGEYPFSCDVCKKGFRQKYRLVAHYEIHSDPVKEAAYLEKLWRDRETVCDVCGKEFTKPYNLKMHYRTHTGERPYKCEECGMSFIQKAHLKSHSYTHTHEYPYVCFVCDKGFCDCSELSSHLQKSHPEHSTL